MRSHLLRITVLAQAALFAMLAVVAAGILGVGLLFALGDASSNDTSRSEVFAVLALASLIVTVPLVVTALLLRAAFRIDRSPRGAATVLLVAESLGTTFLLWPTLRPWIFELTASRDAAVVDLALALPVVVLTAVALASGDAGSAVPRRRRACAAPPARHH